MRFNRGAKFGIATLLTAGMAAHNPQAQSMLQNDSSAYHQTQQNVKKGGKKVVAVSHHQQDAVPVVATPPKQGSHGKAKPSSGKHPRASDMQAGTPYNNEKGFRQRVGKNNRGRSSFDRDHRMQDEHGAAITHEKRFTPLADETPYVSRSEMLAKRKLHAELRDRSIKKARRNKQDVREFYDRMAAHDPETALSEAGKGVDATTAKATLADIHPQCINVKDGRVIGEIRDLPPEWSAEPVVAKQAAAAADIAAGGAAANAGKLTFLNRIGAEAKTSFAAAKPMTKVAKGLGVALSGGLILKGAKDLVAPKQNAEQESSWTDRLKGAGEIAVGTVGGYVALTHGGKPSVIKI